MSTTSPCCWCDPLPCRQALDRSQSQSKLRCSPCIGKKLATDPGILLSFLPSEKPQKRRKRSHTNVSNTLVARPSTPPAQTPQRSFRGTAAGVHTPPQPLTAHTAAHRAKQGRFGWGVVSLPSACAAWSGTSARAAVRRAYFAIFAWTEGTSERSREPSERRRAPCASPFRGAAAPQGRAAPLLFLAQHR